MSRPPPHAAAALAEAAIHTDWNALPAAVREQAADLVLDTLAVIAAANADADPAHAAFAEASARRAGPCTVIGRAQGTGEAAAALANGSATTVLQLQDGHRVARGHPASHIVPAALAIAEATHAGTDAFFSAFVGAYEACVRIGMALGGMRTDIRDAGTWATMGAATAATLLQTRDAQAVERAIEGAASVAMLPWAQPAPQGAGMHHLCIGLAASMGITAADAAIAGLTAIPGTLERFFGPRAGAAFDAHRLIAGIHDGHWSQYELMNAYIKRHGTCAHLHGINDATLALISKHGVRASEVRRIDIATYSHGLAYDNPAPQTALAARFSAAATTAIALQQGRLHALDIRAEALQDKDVQTLMARTTVRHDPALDADYPGGRPARVTLELRDGRTISEHCLHPRGDPGNPMTRAERRSKATGLLALRFGEQHAGAVISAFDAAAEGAPLAPLYAALRGHP